MTEFLILCGVAVGMAVAAFLMAVVISNVLYNHEKN